MSTEPRGPGNRIAAAGGGRPMMVDGAVVPLPVERMRRVATPDGGHVLLMDGDGGPDFVAGEPVAAANGRHRLPEMRSEEMQEIVGGVPGGLLRWGVTVVFGILLLLGGMAFAIRYPEVVRGQAVLTTASPAVRVVAPSGGDLSRLLVREGQQVRRGAWLAILRNPADPDDVAALGGRLDAFAPSLRAGAPVDTGFATPFTLGDVQPDYAAFLLALSQYRAFAGDAYYAAKSATLQAQVAEHGRLRATLAERLRLAEAEARLADRGVERSRQLVREALLSPAEAEEVEGASLQKQQAVADVRNALVANDVQTTGFQGALLDLERERRERELELRLALGSAFDGLRESLRRWEQAFVLRSPLDGRVSFFRPLAEGQYVAGAEPVLAVVPAGPPTAVTVMLSHAAAGRVRPGQRVLLRFDAYPAGEFGEVEGRVRGMSLVGDRAQSDAGKPSLYLVAVDLPRGLVTTHGRRLSPRQELQGTAHVVTDELRVVDRLLHRFRSLSVSSAVDGTPPDPGGGR